MAAMFLLLRMAANIKASKGGLQSRDFPKID